TVTGVTNVSEIAHVENLSIYDSSHITDWDEFMDDGNGFVKEQQGCYRPLTTISSLERNYVMDTAEEVADMEVEYILYAQINYDYEYNPQGKTTVDPEDVISMRCDGFVEYAYEYNDIRIYGDDDCWNISEWGEATNDEHSWGRITPRQQAENYMRFVADINVD
ncbi:MAG: hypothetical protein IJM96_11080, partial [Clostridia bacterium]|nr:hypothetical protein [Clostridia bacterium]